MSDPHAIGARLAGKRALAVGCGQGFGAVTARRMAEQGAAVVVADIDAERAEETAAAITQAGGRARAMAVDIGDEGSVRALVDDAVAWLGGLDVVFNNAAILGTEAIFDDVMRPVFDISTEVWDTTMRVNLRGPWLVCKYALPHLVADGGGSIIQTGSMAVFATMKAGGAYSVSKSGVETLSRIIATQYGKQGVRCNTIHPGLIESRHLPAGYGEAVMLKHLLVDRLGIADDIAMMAIFLASDESGYVTGQALCVDGGMMSHGPTLAEMTAPEAPKNRVAPDGSVV